jgi:NADP-dependent 3-hydroxy acid dehydrogenase YdfG
VILLDKDQSALDEAKKVIPGAILVPADLLNWVETKKALEAIGHVDHLVNNAGVNKREEFLNITPEAIDL